MLRKTILLAGTAASTLLAAAAAHAQTTAPPAPPPTAGDKDNVIAEVIVTAEKRAQSIQQVPVAISAFTSEKRDLIGIQSVVDQTNYTPGLTYSTSLDRVSLRGIGRLSNNHTADAGTAVYIDGVFSTSTTELGRAPLFVDRTEILRGPQGTLYGRNAIGGALNVISKHPTKELSGEVRAAYGNYGVQNYEGFISGPITDWLRFRVSASKYMQEDGYFHNLIPNAPSEGGVRDQNYYEVQLEGEVGKLDWWVKYNSNNWLNRAGPGLVTQGGSNFPFDVSYNGNSSLIPVATFGWNPAALNPTFLGPINGNVVNATGDRRAFETNFPYFNKLTDQGSFATHLTYHLPNFDVRYVGGWQKYTYFQEYDSDSTSVTSYQIPSALGPLTVYPSQRFHYEEDEEFYSHEITLVSTWDNPLQWVAGFYQYHEKAGYPQISYLDGQAQLATPLGGPANPDRIYNYTNYSATIWSKAIFGQIDYKLLPDLKITLGLRYTQDDKKVTEFYRRLCFAVSFCAPATTYGPFTPAVDITSSGINPTAAQLAVQKQQGVISAATIDPVTGVATRKLKDGWNSPTGTAGVEWSPDKHTLAYFKYSRGYKSGGFNAANLSLLLYPYTSNESIDALEAGFKKDWTRRLQTNISGFFYQYYDAQVPLTIQPAGAPSYSVFYNIPRSVNQGVEVETTWSPIDHLNILFNYSYLDSHITKACCVQDPTDPLATQPDAQPVPGGAGSQNIAGNQLPLSPKHKVALNGTYTWPLGKWGDLIGSASYLWRSEQYSSIFNRSYNLVPSRDQIDLRLTFRDAKNRFTVIAYAQNVTDNDNIETRGGIRRSDGVIFQSYQLTDPRTYGVQLQVRF